MKPFIFLFTILALALAGCVPAGDDLGGDAMSMTLTSPSFDNGQSIPSKFSCHGEDISPALDWSAPPKGTQSLVLIMDDPDAPVGTWVHWVIFNIPPATTRLSEGATNFGTDGNNSWKRGGYGGPCPPSGTHRYFFKLYALDAKLDLSPGADKSALEKAMSGHILAKVELMGTFTKP